MARPSSWNLYPPVSSVSSSVGSAVDHLGFSYKDIDAKLKELAEKKVDIVSGVEQEGPIKFAFIRDPWGTLIEVVQDKATKLAYPALSIGGKLQAATRSKGLIVRCGDNGIAIAPPLTISRGELEELVGIVKEAVVEVFA